jgi:hypothetical protein
LGALAGNVTSRKLPAGLLEDGKSYTARIRFIRVSDFGVIDDTGGLAMAAYSAETAFLIKTRVKPSSADLYFSHAAPEGIWASATTGTLAPVYPESGLAQCSLQFVVSSAEEHPETVTFSGPEWSVFHDLESVGFWDHLSPTTRIYYSQSFPAPIQYLSGQYEVRYGDWHMPFVLHAPDRASVLVRIRPSVTLSKGRFSAVTWDYTDFLGDPVSAPATFETLTLRIESDTAQLFHQDGLAVGPATANLPAAIDWSQVRRITFIASDGDGNVFHSASAKWDHPIILSGALPDGERDTAYAATLLAGGGRLPYTWALGGGDPLPAGLQLSAAGLLTGTPGGVGRSYCGIRVTDALGQTADVTAVITVVEPGTPDVVFYRMDLERVYRQTGNGPASTSPGARRQRSFAQVYGVSPASVRSAELVTESGLHYPLTRSFYQNPALTYDEAGEFSSSTEYWFEIVASRDGRRELPVHPFSWSYPQPPHITNWVELQFTPVTGVLRLFFEPWTDGTAADFIYAELRDPDTGGRRTGSMFVPMPGALNGEQTSVGFSLDSLHPPLEPGRAYPVYVAFTRPADWHSSDSNPDYPGVTGIGGYTSSIESTIVTAMNYAAWRDRTFPAAELGKPEVVGTSEDPDADGTINLMEYAVGTDPMTPDSAGVLSSTFEDWTWTVIITYPRLAGAADVEVNLETTARLGPTSAWGPVSVAVPEYRRQEIWEAEEGSLRRWVHTRIQLSGPDEPRFFRLRVQARSS